MNTCCKEADRRSETRSGGHHFTQEFLDSLFSHMFVPLITKPTRITSHSATLIDNIFTNCFQQNSLNGLLLNDISDHFPVFAYFKEDSPTCRKNQVIYKRDYAERNLLKFRTALLQVGEDPNDLLGVPKKSTPL